MRRMGGPVRSLRLGHTGLAFLASLFNYVGAEFESGKEV